MSNTNMLETQKVEAEIAKLIADTSKLNAETMKIHAENQKIQQETLKLNREITWYPVIAAGTAAGAMVAIIAVLSKVF